MNCAQGSEWISRRLDGELSASEEAALRDHLAQCPSCQKLEREQRRLHEAMKAMQGAAMPPDYSQRLREGVWRKVDAPRNSAVSLSFRVTSLAAIIVLSVVVVVLAGQLNESRKVIVRLTAQGQARWEGPSGLPSFPGLSALRNASDERGIAEHVQAFSMVQDYLAGAMRWMAVDGNQVEIGMSGSGAPTPSAAGQPRSEAERILRGQPKKAVVLTFEYIERCNTGESHVLSNPQFILLSGEEASVRLTQKEGNVESLFRYRVRADREATGQIRAEVTFSRETADEAEKPPEVVSPVTASVLVSEGTGVLLGASGDASCRRELYLWAVSRPIPANARQPARGTGHS